MLFARATVTKKRSLVTQDGLATATIAPLDAAAQLRAMRQQTLGEFAPLVAAAAVASCVVVATMLWRHEDPVLLGGWVLLTLAAAWLATRRLQANALAYLNRDVPRRVGFENGAMMSLVAALCSSLPMLLYPNLPDDMRTVVAGTMGATMCGALAIAAAPVAAMSWAGVLSVGLGVAVFVTDDRFRLPMTLAMLLHLGFILVVVRRMGLLAREHAVRLSRQHGEAAVAAQLMRDYEEQGSSFLWHTDADHVLAYASPAIATLLGRSMGQLLGATLPALVGGSDGLGAALRARTAFTGVEVDLPDGRRTRTIAFSATPVIDEGGSFRGFRGHCTDVTATRSSERRLRQLASLDMLTELPNRMRIRELLAETLLAVRDGKRTCGILMLDLDGFKPVNDSFGHPKGDAVLRTVAARLVETAAGFGTIGRLGGDEFAMVFADASPLAVQDMAAGLIARVAEPYDVDGIAVRIGLSIGSATAPLDGDSVDELIRKADLALYEAKAAGRATYRPFEPGMQTVVEDRLRLEHDLRRALALDQLHLAYQPLIHARTQDVTGFEALIRWQHPERGAISPVDFIPLAEETGLIHAIGEWAMRTAIRDCARWPEPVTVAINLSPIQLKSAHLPATIADALAQTRVAANRVTFEVTEGVFVSGSDASLDVLRRLRALGVRIALDDFGTGYSSLGYLNRTIFHKLKIDGSFVRDAAQRPETVSIIQAIVTLANCFQMTITAEGIETPEDYRRMVDLGCHEMQGYLFGRPVPFDRACELVGSTWSERARRTA